MIRYDTIEELTWTQKLNVISLIWHTYPEKNIKKEETKTNKRSTHLV